MLQVPYRILGSNWNHVSPTSIIRQISTAGFPLQFNVSPFLFSSPIKAKKKIDPNVLRQREERRKKKIEKQIRSLKRLDKQLKPVFETELPIAIKDEPEKRKRIVDVPEDVKEKRIVLLKIWSKRKLKDYFENLEMMSKLISSQEKALKELRLESEELYQAAVKIDENLTPFQFSGPSETPAIENYRTPDGDFVDISRKWV